MRQKCNQKSQTEQDSILERQCTYVASILVQIRFNSLLRETLLYLLPEKVHMITVLLLLVLADKPPVAFCSFQDSLKSGIRISN
jgi:hypothetical protein